MTDEQSLSDLISDKGDAEEIEKRLKVFSQQPKQLVRHNSLLWAIRDISLDTKDRTCTLELWGLPSVYCQVPLVACFVVNNVVARPRAAVRRNRYLEVKELQYSYLVGPTPCRVDDRGHAYPISDGWMSPAPMTFWPRGTYTLKEQSTDKTIPFIPNDGSHPILYTFVPKDDHKEDFEECHVSMQHLNLRPDIYAQCANPRFRGCKSWTHTCTAAATGAIYIDKTIKTINNPNEWTVQVYKWSSATASPEANLFDWAIPVKQEEVMVPMAIGADLMGPRSSTRRTLTTWYFRELEFDTSPLQGIERYKDYYLQYLRRSGEESQFDEVLKVFENFRQELILAYIKMVGTAKPYEKVKGYLEAFCTFVDTKIKEKTINDYPYSKTLFATSETIINACSTADKSAKDLVKLEIFPTNYEEVYTKDYLTRTSEGHNIFSLLNDLFKTDTTGAECEFLWSLQTAESTVKTEYLHRFRNTEVWKKIKNKLRTIVLINECTTRTKKKMHKFHTTEQKHLFGAQATFQCKDDLNMTFGFQQSNVVCSWQSNAAMLGNFPFLHTTAPLRPQSTNALHAYRTPIHILDLIDMAYGDGTYPNILTLKKNGNAIVMLDPELPDHEVLDDLYKHVTVNGSSAVLSAAIATYGPIGVSGTPAITWTVLYEYYNAMHIPQNAFMQYILGITLDDIALTPVKAGAKSSDEDAKAESGLDKDLSDSGYELALWSALTLIGTAAMVSNGVGLFTAAVSAATTSQTFMSVAPKVKNLIYDRDVSKSGRTATSAIENARNNGSNLEFFLDLLEVAKSTVSGDEKTVKKEIEFFIRRSNVISAGKIAGAYYLSRVPIGIQTPLATDILEVVRPRWNTYATGRNMLKERSYVDRAFDFFRASVFENKFTWEIRELIRQTFAHFNETILFREHGKPDANWIFRFNSAGRHHADSCRSFEDLLQLHACGRKRIMTMPFYEAEFFVMFCSNAVAHERWASLPMRQDSGRQLVSPKSQLDMILSTHVRMLGPVPLLSPRAPQAIPSPKFRVVMPVGAQTPQSMLQWVTSNPSLSGFGFVYDMTAYGGAAIDMPVVSLDFTRRVATAIAFVYARNSLIRTTWLRKAMEGPQHGSNAPIEEHVPDRAPEGLFSTADLMEMFSE